MSQSITLDMKGEHTYASDLSGVPQGSLALGLNININRLGIAEPRPGFDLLAYGLPLAGDRARQIVYWNAGLFAHYNDATFAYYDSGSGFSSRGSLGKPSNATSSRFVKSANKNLYVTGSDGLKRTDAVATSLSAAGVPKGLTIDLSLAGAGSAVADTKYVTYRYLVAKKDANSNIAFGGVSGRFTLQNSAGSTQNVTATCYIPTGLDTTYFLQLYRTKAAATSDTGDEQQLCFEQPLSSSDVSNGYVVVTDLYPDSLLGATIYTAPSQQGLVNDNASPPLARDIAEYKTCMFYADVDSPHRLQFSLISVGGTGLVSGDTIVVTKGATTETYTAKSFGVTITIASPAVVSQPSHGLSAGDPVVFSTTGALPTGLAAGTVYYVISAGLTANAFEVAATVGGTAINTSGIQSGAHTCYPFSVSSKFFPAITSGSTSQNIDATIKGFIKLVNLTSAIVYAYSMSESATDLPGKVLLEAKTISATGFTAVSTRPSAFLPQLSSPASVNNTSTQDSFAHGLMWSKPGQPEAVPIKNILKVGSSDNRIKRIVALRDALLIFKEGDGTWYLTGDDEAHWSVKLLDGTARIIAPDSLAVVNNFVYGLFEAGVCQVSSDGGVSIISVPIKDQLLPLYGAPLANLKALTFGFGSDVDGKYVLSVPTAATDTYTVRQHVYDTFGGTWCKWDIPTTAGGLNPADAKLYLAVGDSNRIKQQFRNFDYTDYADFKTFCTISSYVGTQVFIDNIAGMAVGDLLFQGDDNQAYIEEIHASEGYVVIDDTQTWTLSTADVSHMSAIDCKVQWNPDVAGNGAGLKMYSECSILQKQTFQKQASLVFSSDINPSEVTIPVTSASGNGAWGQFDFGDEVFGGEQARAPKRVGVPRGHARCSQLSVRFENQVAFSDFQIEGLSLTFTPTGTRTTR